MAHIILAVALILAGWFIVLDWKRRPSFSGAIWIPTLVVTILCSRTISLWLRGGGSVYYEMGNESSTSLLDLIYFAGVIAGSAFVTARRGVSWTKFLLTNSTTLLLYLYFTMSVAWSNDPTGSLKRIIKDFGMIFVIGVILTEKDPLQAMRAVYVRSAALLIPLSIVFIRYFPAYGRVYARGGGMTVTGVTTQKNTLGEIILIFSLFFLWDYLEDRKTSTKKRWRGIHWDHVLLGIMGLWLMHASQSKTALLCLLIGVLMFVRYRGLCSRATNIAIYAGAVALPFLLFFSQVFSFVIEPIVEAMGRNMTFTGRANIWAQITLQTVNPLVGCGFWDFWGGPGGNAISMALNTTVPNAHDGYLDIYLDGGFIGLAILFVFLIGNGRRLIRRFVRLGRNNYFARISFAMVILTIVSNLTESSFARIGPLWFTTLLMVVEFPRSRGAKKAKLNAGLNTSGNVDQEHAVLAN